MLRKPQPKQVSNSEKIDNFYKAERFRRLRLGAAVLAPAAFILFALNYTNAPSEEVVATVTPNNVSYRTKASHRQQVELADGQLLMIELPHEVMLTPGEKVVL